MDKDYDDQVGYNWLDALESESLSGDGLTLPNLCELRLAGISVDVKFSGHLKSVLDRRALQLGKPLSMLSITPQRPGIPWPELALNLGGVKHFFYHSDGVHRVPMCTCTLVCRAHD
ncbi:hypothetical protein QCA50_018938 [Cerrena zonata]|uniref:Uncharacterized protein n=1 Tax=Cerrena zonata TaxID=2478898 RepID=A0AAW0FIZ9_9APHY